MKISFNLISCGLNNNGGSQTLILSANTLQKLGNIVTIVDSGKNQNTWNKIECNHKIIKNLKDYPTGDIVIATGFKTVDSTLKLSKECGIKYHYIRLFEDYVCNEVQLKEIIKAPTKKIVNSLCLQRKLLTYEEPSIIIRPGYDFDKIFPLDIRKDNTDVIIGGLYSEGLKRKKKRTEWIVECYNYLKTKYNIKLFMFGANGTPNFKVDYYIKNPNFKEKNKLYNMVDIWLSPSCFEGLHIPPAEAMLTESVVVGNGSDQSGTEDYLIDNETGLVSEDNFNSFLANVEILVKHKILRKELGVSGRLKILSLGTREDNMKEMIKVFKNE